MKIVHFVSIWLFVIVGVKSSAIPMWEYLSKQEKMSYLYSMFANQVETFCNEYQTKMNNCNRELLKYGLSKLKVMPEDHLDSMDPYQRGAGNIIWEGMMEGHEMATKQSFNPRDTTQSQHTQTKPNSYDDDSIDYTNSYPEFGSQGAASARIDNEYRVLPPKGFKYQLKNNQEQTEKAYKLGRINSISSSSVKQNVEGTTTKSNIQNIIPSYTPIDATHTRVYYSHNTERIMVGSVGEGPMVVRVYPDGRPVVSSSIGGTFGGTLYQQLPQDEDLRQYRLSKVKIPSF